MDTAIPTTTDPRTMNPERSREGSQRASVSYGMKDILGSMELDLPRLGDVIEGEIISVSKNSVLIDLGTLGTGIVYPGEFYDNPDTQKSLHTGQRVHTILLDIENEENGYRELSLKRAQTNTAWQDIHEKMESGEVISTKVININKGGLIVEINGVQGFLPLSQLSSKNYPKVDGGDTSKIVNALQKFRGEEIKIKIIDFSEEDRKLIVSEKAIYADQLKDEMAKFKVGDIVEGEVSDVTDFGAFVKISEAVEGLVHISEIDWKLIDNPRDYLKVGDKVSAKVVSTDGNKISLSLKALKEDPWLKIEGKYTVGQKLAGTVAKVTDFGAMIKLNGDEIMGFVPKAEMSDDSTPLKAGEEYNFAIVSIDTPNHKMILTLDNRDKRQETPVPSEIGATGQASDQVQDENKKEEN